MNRLKLLAAFLPLALLVGCASATIVSSVDKSRQYQIEELHIVSKGPIDAISQRYAKTLSDRLTTINVLNDIQVASKIPTLHQDNEPSGLEKIVQGTVKTNILICSMTTVETANGSAERIEMNAVIFNKEVNRFIWRSKIVAENFAQRGRGIEGALLYEIAGKTIEKLKADGLLPQTPAKLNAENAAKLNAAKQNLYGSEF